MKVKRNMVVIDEEKCNGCGACVTACHEGAIVLIDGKARLLREDYCDGLGDCLPACPVDAISIEEREALPFNEEAVLLAKSSSPIPSPCSCPGTRVQSLVRPKLTSSNALAGAKAESELRHWPVQLKLVPVNAAFFHDSDLLIAADCSAFAYANFHQEFLRSRVCLIGCPKLDGVDYSEKLSQILVQNKINSLTVVRMEVPCCSGLEGAARRALSKSGNKIDLNVVVVTTQGRVL